MQGALSGIALTGKPTESHAELLTVQLPTQHEQPQCRVSWQLFRTLLINKIRRWCYTLTQCAPSAAVSTPMLKAPPPTQHPCLVLLRYSSSTRVSSDFRASCKAAEATNVDPAATPRCYKVACQVSGVWRMYHMSSVLQQQQGQSRAPALSSLPQTWEKSRLYSNAQACAVLSIAVNNWTHQRPPHFKLNAANTGFAWRVVCLSFQLTPVCACTAAWLQVKHATQCMAASTKWAGVCCQGMLPTAGRADHFTC